MDTAELSLEFTNDLDELENLRGNIEQFLQSKRSAQENCIFELNLVIDEIFTNIVSYGFTDKKKHWIKIDIRIIDSELTHGPGGRRWSAV
jgi:serine/threonine-protein kinase RsbW